MWNASRKNQMLADAEDPGQRLPRDDTREEAPRRVEDREAVPDLLLEIAHAARPDDDEQRDHGRPDDEDHDRRPWMVDRPAPVQRRQAGEDVERRKDSGEQRPDEHDGGDDGVEQRLDDQRRRQGRVRRPGQLRFDEHELHHVSRAGRRDGVDAGAGEVRAGHAIERHADRSGKAAATIARQATARQRRRSSWSPSAIPTACHFTSASSEKNVSTASKRSCTDANDRRRRLVHGERSPRRRISRSPPRGVPRAPGHGQPGSGSASALTVAFAAGLVAMVARRQRVAGRTRAVCAAQALALQARAAPLALADAQVWGEALEALTDAAGSPTSPNGALESQARASGRGSAADRRGGGGHGVAGGSRRRARRGHLPGGRGFGGRARGGLRTRRRASRHPSTSRSRATTTGSCVPGRANRLRPMPPRAHSTRAT